MKRLFSILLLLLCGLADVHAAGPAARVAIQQGGGSVSALRAQVKALQPVLWLDGSDLSTITQTNGLISAWADKSGGGYTFAQSTDSAKPFLTRSDSLENRIKNSEDASAANWGASGLGARTATSITEDSSTGAHRIDQPVEFVKGASYAFTARVSAGTRSWMRLVADNPDKTVYFDLTNGVKGTDVASLGSIVAVGGGVYDVTMTFTAAASGVDSVQVGMCSADDTPSYAGNGTGSINVLRTHLARTGKGYVTTTTYPQYAGLNGRAVPYFPGAATYMSRAFTAALDLFTGSNSVFVVVSPDGAADAATNYYLLDNGTANSKGMNWYLQGASLLDIVTTFDGSANATNSSAAAVMGVLGLRTLVESGTNLKYYVNGSAAGNTSQANAVTSSANALNIGASLAAGSGIRGYLPEVIVFNRALGASETAIVNKYEAKAWPLDLN